MLNEATVVRERVPASQLAEPTAADRAEDAVDGGMSSRAQAAELMGHGGGSSDAAPSTMNSPNGQLTHAEPTARMGVTVDDTGARHRLPADATASTAAESLHVQLNATETNKLTLPVGEVPAEERLFSRLDDGASAVEFVQGTPTAPNTAARIYADRLFINGAPDAADVRQGNIGDCYFMAVLLGIVNGDPGQLRSMMSLSGASVTTSFYRLDNASGEWISAQVTNDTGLQVFNDNAGAPTESLKGAQLRIDDTPRTARWWAAVEGDTLQIHREDMHESALWGPLMEKSYADYVQRWGKYGEGLSASEQGNGGYDIITTGGGSQRCYPMFYGDGVVDTDTQGMNYAPGSDLLATNLDALARLIRFEGKKHHPGLPGGEQEFMQVRIGSGSAITRLGALVDATLTHHQAQQEAGASPDTFTTELQALDGLIDTWSGAQSDANRNAVVTRARTIQTPGAHPVLWDEASDKTYHDLLEVLGIVINLGTDQGPGRRMVYASHAYNVHTVALRDTHGADLEIPEANLSARVSEIDAIQSTVILENPHARNEPDLDGTGPVDGVNEGRFTLTLDGFFRNFDLLRLATVEHDPAMGDFPTPDPNGPQYA